MCRRSARPPRPSAGRRRWPRDDPAACAGSSWRRDPCSPAGTRRIRRADTARRPAAGRPGIGLAGCEPVGRAVELARRELRRVPQAVAGIAERDARPAREVVVGHRPAARDEATGEVDQRLCSASARGPRPRSPVVEQDERRLLALHRPDADESVTGEPRDDVVPPLPGRRDAGVLEQAEHVGTAQAAVAGERPDEQFAAAIELAGRDARAACGGAPRRRRGAGRTAPGASARPPAPRSGWCRASARCARSADRRSRAPPSSIVRRRSREPTAHSDWP